MTFKKTKAQIDRRYLKTLQCWYTGINYKGVSE
jgi:hypothetical protein